MSSHRRVVFGGQPQGEVFELGGGPGSATLRGVDRRRVEGIGDLGVGRGRGQGEVPSSLLGVGDRPGESSMRVPPPCRGRLPVDGGSEERVREHDLTGAEDADDPRRFGGPQAVLARTARFTKELDRGAGGGRRQEQDVLRLGRDRLDAIVEQVAKVVGDRERFSRRRLPVDRSHRPHDLEAEQRVAARGLVDLDQDRPGEAPVGAFMDQPREHVQGERSHVQPGQTLTERRREVERIGDPFGDPQGREHRDGLGLQTSQDERQGVRGRRVDPLHVVDGEQHRSLVREQPERTQDRHGNGVTVRAPVVALRAEQGHLQRPALGSRELIGHMLEAFVQQIGEGGVGERRLRLPRTARQDVGTRCCGERDALEPQDGLPDPRRAAEDHAGRSCRGRLDERHDRSEFVLTSDRLVAGHRRASTRPHGPDGPGQP